MFNFVIAFLFLGFMAVTSIIFFVVALIIWLFTVLFDKKLKALHMLTSFWGSLYLWVMPAWAISSKGREKISKDQTYVIVSNHQSQLDILLAFTLFFPFKWVSKAEIFKVPFIGWNMSLNGYIKLKRGRHGSIKQMLRDCEKMLKTGNSVYLFPEGTRSETGEVRYFKPGAFALAKRLKLPILPIAINGSKDALPKGSLNYHGVKNVSIEVLDEVKYEDYCEMEPAEIAELVKAKISEKVTLN